MLQMAPTQPPPPPYWSTDGQDQVAEVRFDAEGNLYTITDPSGQNRRVWEGWASLEGIDWEDEDYPATVFETAMQTYTQKNPVVLWDHIRSMPIGTITEWQVEPSKGLFVRGYLYDERDFPFGGEILAKCNEVWPLVRSGRIRGISWVGVARKRWVHSDDLGKTVKQATEVLVYEITITPTQVNPGAKITGVSVAKAIGVCKSLSIGDRNMSKIKELQDAQAAYIAALHKLEDGATLSPEIVENQAAISRAMGLEPASKAIDPTPQPGETKPNEPAPLRNQTNRSGSAPKPGSEPLSDWDRAAKALQIGGNIRDGKLDMGKGEPLPVTGPDLMGLYMHVNGMALNWPQQRNRPDITHSEGIAKLLDRASA